MRLYSYRGVSYTLAPPALSSTHHDPTDGPSSGELSPRQSSTQKVAPPLSQPQTPTAVIPMVYRGVLYLLERFHTPSPTLNTEFIDACSDESIESAESAKSADE